VIGLFAASSQRDASLVAASLGADAVLVDGPIRPALGRLWPQLGSVVFFLGAGAVVRLIAPLLENKQSDPGVVCVHDGFVVALTAGGNILAEAIAETLGCVAVPTSDYVGATPLDELVDTLQTAVDGDLAGCGAAVLAGEPVRLLNPLGFLLPDLPTNLQPDNYGTEWTILIDDRVPSFRTRGKLLRLIPQTLVVGVGSVRGVTPEAVTAAFGLLESEHDLDLRAVRSFATIDAKADEAGILSAVEDWGFWHGSRDGCVPPLALRTAAELAQVDVPNPAAGVLAEVGTPSVAEASALFTARELGANVELAAPKTSNDTVTVAAARILPTL
jgi:cobalt-precorrin 5A hydrolase/precorrin-3B C17-methyltransferase